MLLRYVHAVLLASTYFTYYLIHFDLPIDFQVWTMQHLIEKVNLCSKLRARTGQVPNGFQFPKIAVIGPQSSGKTSVLEVTNLRKSNYSIERESRARVAQKEPVDCMNTKTLHSISLC